MNKYTINSTYFDSIDTPEKAQILGFLFADGFVGRKMFGVVICEKDFNYLNEIKNRLKSTHPIRVSKNKKYIRFYVSNVHMFNALISQGCVQRKSLILKFPTKIQKELYRFFILGYFEGDGSLFITKGKRISPGFNICGTYDMCNFIKNYIHEHTNIKLSFEKYKTKSGKIYGLSSRGRRKIVKIMDFLYDGCTFKMDRKYLKFLEIKEKLKPKTSNHVGISFYENKWRGELKIGNKRIKTKRTDSEESAIILYNNLCENLGIRDKIIKL